MSREADGEAFAGSVVSLGALGVVTRLTLDGRAVVRVRQDVYEDLPIAAFRDHFDDAHRVGRQREPVPRWRGRRDRPGVAQAARSRRATTAGAALDLFGARRATTALHPLGRLPPDACTEQLGVPGPWLDRLPHFRLDHTPSHGDELQSEFFVGREHAVAAFEALDALRRPPRAAGVRQRDPHHRRRRPLAQPGLRARLGGLPLHLASGLAGGPCRARPTSRPRSSRSSPVRTGRSCSRWPRRSYARATRGWARSRTWPAAPTRTASSATSCSRGMSSPRRPRRATANVARSHRAPGRVHLGPRVPDSPPDHHYAAGSRLGVASCSASMSTSFRHPDGPSLRLVMARDPGHPVSVGEIGATGAVDRPDRIAGAPTWRWTSVEGRMMNAEPATSIAEDARRAFVLNDRPMHRRPDRADPEPRAVRRAVGPELRRGHEDPGDLGAGHRRARHGPRGHPARSCTALGHPTRCDPARRRSSA